MNRAYLECCTFHSAFERIFYPFVFCLPFSFAILSCSDLLPDLRNLAHSKMASDTVDELVLTDRDLVSLYMKYPEMSLAFEDDDDDDQEKEQSFEGVDNASAIFSSPTSSFQTISTAETTPPRFDPVIAAFTTETDDYQAFLELLKKAELPSSTRTYFTSLVNRIRRISCLLFSPQETTSTTAMFTEVLDHCHILTDSLKPSCGKVEEQLANLIFVRSLAPFNVSPQASHAWTNYCQMAELLIT